MEQDTPIEEKKSFLRNDRKLVCSMFVVYGLCILGLVTATIWGLTQRSKRIAANATSTANAGATQQAKVTATAVARTTEQAQYKFVDLFNDNTQFWFTDAVDDKYMKGSPAIKNGVYIWDIQKVKQTFVHWAHFRKGSHFKDFDVYVDSKIDSEKLGDACSGFAFRTASRNWDAGAYTFSVCNNSSFSVDYKQEKWENISGWLYSEAIQNKEWNRLEIKARGNHFTFIINNEVVFEMTDERLAKGAVALLIDVKEERPVTIRFDNFGLQPR